MGHWGQWGLIYFFAFGFLGFCGLFLFKFRFLLFTSTTLSTSFSLFFGGLGLSLFQWLVHFFGCLKKAQKREGAKARKEKCAKEGNAIEIKIK